MEPVTSNVSTSEAIFCSIKRRSTIQEPISQEEISIDEIVSALELVLLPSGLVSSSKEVQNLVYDFVFKHKIFKEASFMDKETFEKLLNSWLDYFINNYSRGDGIISKDTFVEKYKHLHGWQAWVAKKYIKKTWDNATARAYGESTEELGRKEIKTLVLLFLENELSDEIAKPFFCKFVNK
mmetsp:Transcript_7055/g.7744  ORF Transcript_7055/g.7744 Transcript_7055/m.7744 type:complete len:181 (+) Transcript_7055:150-692(+)